ncbi:Scytalone dehydratase, variant 2 [Balamuthia mandrillaris]
MQNEAEASPLLSVVHTPPPLPQEVFISIFSHLRPKDLYRVGLVCKSWNQVLRNDNLWRALFFRCFGEPAEPGRPSSQAASVMSSSSSFWRTKFQTAQNWYKKEGQGYTSFALHRGVDPLPNVGGGQSQQHHPQQSHEEQQQPPPNAHMGGVLALRLLSPSVGTGRKIAISGGADAALMIWDVTPSGSLSSSSSTRRNNGGRGKLLGVLKGHRGPVWAIDCTATQFASASDDATVKVWDLNRGRLLRTLRTHSAPVLCVQMDADKLLSGGHDGTLSLCDLRTGKETAATIKLKAYTSSVRSMHQPRQEENHVIVGTEGGRVKVLDLRNGRCVQVFKEHARFVSCLHADAQRIISGSPDWTVKVWDRQTGISHFFSLFSLAVSLLFFLLSRFRFFFSIAILTLLLIHNRRMHRNIRRTYERSLVPQV